MKSRTAVSARPLASAKTTRFFRPQLSLRKQLWGSDGEGEGGSDEEEDDEDTEEDEEEVEEWRGE